MERGRPTGKDSSRDLAGRRGTRADPAGVEAEVQRGWPDWARQRIGEVRRQLGVLLALHREAMAREPPAVKRKGERDGMRESYGRRQENERQGRRHGLIRCSGEVAARPEELRRPVPRELLGGEEVGVRG